ncbi:ORF1 [Torque teno virus 3]|uniref:Capsid protein n=1 Tax=Torque teno virus (isolate Human/Finland/Hel32/2002) TaxID=687342 RepID=CAPSD_TTVV3|nr:ORF1 [Torque teno virus 3]A7XCE4.1 RecName: Full=Capsid protein [Torque teno virus 3]ABV25035.1 ORF1 [Torque teno virus 3]
MAWYWWRRRRRRGWWKPRRRRWRRRRARRRGPARRHRARRRVRRRRGRWRRRYRRWRRRGGRRRHRKKLIIKQWQPNFIRHCYIIGYMPLIICGENTFSHNYATHSDDMLSTGPYGGGMTTTKFTLRILFDEYQRHLNFWTVSNQDLDLARYLGTKIIFFRHPTVDFVVQIHTQPPFQDTEITAPSIHPGMLILSKKHILIPSLKTRPSKKHYVKVRVGAPRLFQDKWYPQSELCDVTLLVIYATACDLQYPFGSPQTDNVCVNFQILGQPYYQHLKTALGLTEKTTYENHYKNNLYKKIKFYNTTETIAQLKPLVDATTNQTWSHYVNPNKLTTTPTSEITHNNTWYRGNAYNDKITDLPEIVKKSYYKATELAIPEAVKPTTDLFEYHAGIYSSIFLSPGRAYFETPGAYQDIIYNPFTDKGIGNIVWIDWLSKSDAVYSEKQSKCGIFDLPLWAAFFGYAEFCSKSTGDTAIAYNSRVCVRCPYTEPQLLNHNNPSQGYVFYSYNFGKGKMPGGSSQVPIRMRWKWYVCMFHQLEVMEAICQSGPFAYHSDEKKAVLGIKYKFDWKWGGNPISQQIVRHPCNGQTSSGNRVPRSVQAVDPKYVSLQLVWHSWDFRRGLFGQAGIKRMQQESDALTLSPVHRPKRPKRDTQVKEKTPEKDSDSAVQLRRLQPWIHSSQETKDEEEEIPEGPVQEQLLQQLQQQRLLRVQLESIAQEVLKIRRGHSLHPLLSSHA